MICHLLFRDLYDIQEFLLTHKFVLKTAQIAKVFCSWLVNLESHKLDMKTHFDNTVLNWPADRDNNRDTSISGVTQFWTRSSFLFFNVNVRNYARLNFRHNTLHLIVWKCVNYSYLLYCLYCIRTEVCLCFMTIRKL